MTARAAMERCYLAWQRTEMQLPFELDEAPDPWPHSPSAGGLVEPERLTSGAEPCCDQVAAPTVLSVGSAPSPHRPREV